MKIIITLKKFCKWLTTTICKKLSGKSGWKVNGTRLFGSASQRKISGSKGTSGKVVLFFRMKYFKQKFVLHFFKAIFDTSLKSFAAVFQ